ncbi:MAG: hypothetical protein ISR59_12000 [Anaerolineales bacterium]|uniref:Alanyl-transfer RNA synthetases family profile domain-containing protein n=1 Tax=Candidatus Desulfolinea nitratireducens TaxID=2841698 RepID=A0A8J6NJY8_9CHLR|nr:hypothetical protein [Candidatus Desulfolinea nitratireducens]MBL6961822.1 hypothetical protein [Anaerolineales bacterium]
MTKKLYFDDPMTMEFTAEVVETRTLTDGRFGAILPSTFFYPTGGGQSYDMGTIGTARVVDVFIEADEIVHVLDREVEPGSYPARIDEKRRFRHMQHHTGQHILSAAFATDLGFETLSSHISGETPSSIDFDAETLSSDDISRMEKLANQIIFENREVKTYFVKDIDSVPFRRPPKVSGSIRVVEVEGFDYSACGGTHFPQTGMVGLVKIVKTERINHKARIYFVAGWQALEFLQQVQSISQGIAAELDTGVEGLPEALSNLQGQLKEAQSELKPLRDIAMNVEIEKMVQLAEKVDENWLVTKIYENRSPADLRTLAIQLRNYPSMVALLASLEDEKLSLVISCATDSGLNANDLLQKHLAPYQGRGGGDNTIAQGGGVAKNIDGIFNQSIEMIRNP